MTTPSKVSAVWTCTTSTGPWLGWETSFRKTSRTGPRLSLPAPTRTSLRRSCSRGVAICSPIWTSCFSTPRRSTSRGSVAAFLLSSGDEHPISTTLTASHHVLRIVPQYAMLAFGALRRFRLVLQSLLERGVPQPRLPHPGAHLAAAGSAQRADFGCLLRHRLPGRTAGRPRIPRHRHRRLREDDRARPRKRAHRRVPDRRRQPVPRAR